jgi:DNA mismatch repair protein MutS2
MPSSLLHSSARVLEFESLRDLIRGYTSSPLGRDRVAALSPSVDRQWIENQHRLTNEIREFRRVGGRFEFSGLLDISSPVEKARIHGAVLETTEIRDVVLVIDRAAEWRGISLSPPAAMKVAWAAVAQLSSSIIDFSEFLRTFRNKIQPDGTL